MHAKNRSKLNRLASTGIALGVGAGLLAISGPVFADPAQAPAYSAAAAAKLVQVQAVKPGLLPLNDEKALVDVQVSTADSSVDSTKPGSVAKAANLSANVADLVKAKIQEISQAAPPDNAKPASKDLAKVDLGVAKVNVGHVDAHARWSDQTAKPTGEVKITESNSELVDLEVLPGHKLPTDLTAKLGVDLDGPLTHSSKSLVHAEVGKAHTETGLTAVEGQKQLGVKAQARASLASVKLFEGTKHQIAIKVVSEPTLTGVAAGSNKSSVKYTAPILEITHGDKEVVKVDGSHKTAEVKIGPNDGDIVRISIPDFKKNVTANSVAAEGHSVRVEVLDGKLLDVSLGKLQVAATAPAGGIEIPGNPTPSASVAPSKAAGKGGSDSLPVTGANAGILIAAGLVIAAAGGTFVVMARRRNANSTPSAS